jgi:hypothetical protein
MGATQRRFTYKCQEGHLSFRDFPLGTRYEDHETIFCKDCSHGEYAMVAYLVAADIVQDKDSSNGTRSA